MYESILSELKFKERTLQDIARFIGTRNEETPNYSLFLGAGCSVTSGIKTATELVTMWRKEVILQDFPDTADKSEDEQIAALSSTRWYDRTKEYSCLFERRYDLQPQRRRFVENEVSGKQPSIGYAYLTSLIGKNYFNTIFTTNFDDLLNEAFFQFSDQRPIICAHDSSINSITITSRRPKIIKLHGDYLFDDIKATTRETESLEQNMKLKFTEFAKNTGLIVVGYAGGDRSIMDVLSSLLRNEEYFKAGIYWCVQKGSSISDELRNLLWKDRVFFVQIPGFDELFADLHSILHGENTLPISTSKISNKNTQIIRSLIENKYLENSSSTTLQRAHSILKRETTTNRLYDLIKQFKSDGDENDSDRIPDSELISLMEAQQFSDARDYQHATELCKIKLKETDRKTTRIALLNSIIENSCLNNNMAEALSAIEEIIKLEPKNPDHHLKKSSLQMSLGEKLESINQAGKISPYYYKPHLFKAKILKEYALDNTGSTRINHINDAIEELDLGIQRNPNISNMCWSTKFDLANLLPDKKEARSIKETIVEKLSQQNPQHWKVLNFRVQLLNSDDKDELKNTLESGIRDSLKEVHDEMQPMVMGVLLKFLKKTKKITILRSELDTISSEMKKNTDLLSVIATLERNAFGNDKLAANLWQSMLDEKQIYSVADDLIECYLDLNEIQKAESVYNSTQFHVSFRIKTQLKIEILEWHKKYLDAVIELKKYKNLTSVNCPGVDENYLLLLAGEKGQAESNLRALLKDCNYSLDASTDIVNLEYIQQLNGKKVNVDRLNAVREYTDNDAIKAACSLLCGNKEQCIQHIKSAIEENRHLRHDFKKWPIFRQLEADTHFCELVGKPL